LTIQSQAPENGNNEYAAHAQCRNARGYHCHLSRIDARSHRKNKAVDLGCGINRSDTFDRIRGCLAEKQVIT